MIVIGLTGSIGMGKSTCGAMLQDLGVPVHESDLAVHDLLSNDADTQSDIIKAFPQLSMPIDRKALGQIVFSNDGARTQLEAILHPRVRQAQADFVARQTVDIVCLDIPLLYETQADKRVDYVVVVHAPAHIQAQRVLARPNMSADKLKAILSRQMDSEEKCKRADFVIDTSTSTDQTHDQIKAMLQKIKEQTC